MRKVLTTFMLISFLSLITLAKDFRYINWGMDKSEVSMNEMSTLYERGNNYLVYEMKLYGIESYLIYKFDNNSCYEAMYYFLENHWDEDDYFKDYEKVKKGLISQYGKPRSFEEKYTDNYYENKPDKKGYALNQGILTVESIWQYPETTVILTLAKPEGEDYILMTLAYRNLFNDFYTYILDFKENIERDFDF